MTFKEVFEQMDKVEPPKQGIRVTRLECVKPDWKRVVNAARRTAGKKPIDKEPSDLFKRKMLLSEHSPIRLLEYDFTWEDIKQWVTVHLVRHHEGCEKFVHSQRGDRPKILEDYGVQTRDELPQGALNDMDMTANAQALINISRKRLCNCASKETREAWIKVKEAIAEIDPVMASKMVPECIYRGFCPEVDNCCGYCNTEKYQNDLKEYSQAQYSAPDAFIRRVQEIIAAAYKNKVNVLLCTPLAQPYYKEGVLIDRLGSYTEMIRHIAAYNHIGLLDLEQTTREWLQGMTEQEAAKYYVTLDENALANGEYQLNEEGATVVAGIVRDAIVNTNSKKLKKILKK